MCISGRLGLNLDLDGGDPMRTLFGETNGCLLVEVTPGHAVEFEQIFAGLPLRKTGYVQADPRLNIQSHGRLQLSVSITDLISAWNTPLQPT